MAWGKFCDSMYDKSKEAQWLEFLATCYLQVWLLLAGFAAIPAACNCPPQHQLCLTPRAQPPLLCGTMQAIRLASTDARDLVPRLLQLLMVEPKGAEMLGRAVAQKAADLPGWIWLPWIPQLMTSLQRPEVAVARRILSAAASSFPQQLYWHVRPSMLAMKDAAVKAVQDAKAQASPGSINFSLSNSAMVCLSSRGGVGWGVGGACNHHTSEWFAGQ